MTTRGAININITFQSTTLMKKKKQIGATSFLIGWWFWWMIVLLVLYTHGCFFLSQMKVEGIESRTNFYLLSQKKKANPIEIIEATCQWPTWAMLWSIKGRQDFRPIWCVLSLGHEFHFFGGGWSGNDRGGCMIFFFFWVVTVGGPFFSLPTWYLESQGRDSTLGLEYDPKAISEMWKAHFSQGLNCIQQKL